MFLSALSFRNTALTTHESVRLMNSLGSSLAVIPSSQNQVKKQLSNTIPQVSTFNFTNYKCNNKMPIRSMQSITFQT
jgi:hypothetical protein